MPYFQMSDVTYKKPSWTSRSTGGIDFDFCFGYGIASL